MKNIIYVLLLLLFSVLQAQELKSNWKFKTAGKVLASPLIHNETVFIGDQKGIFYALDLNTGKEMWKLETSGNIQAKATRIDESIFFESANVFYLVDAESGKVRWTYDTGMEPFFKYEDRKWPNKIDPFDDKRSIACYKDGIIYVGCGDGNIYGFNASNGAVLVKYPSDEDAPIRSTPLIQNGTLYFGDWNGMVYSYSLENESLNWKKKTYRGEKPYGTFGGVVSEFLVYDGLLFFGARNYMLNVLDLKTGEKEWTYTDAQKGWIIGDPVIFKDTLYIGGSDNYSMLAFDPVIGRPIWAQNGGKNIYTKPIVTEEWVIYTSGNGYNLNDTGILFVLDRESGKVLSQFDLPKGSFSSPELIGDTIVFGCYDGNVYAVTIQ